MFFYYINEIRTMSKIIDLWGLTFSANPQAIKQKKNQTPQKNPQKLIKFGSLFCKLSIDNFDIILRVTPWILFKKWNKNRYHIAKLIFM